MIDEGPSSQDIERFGGDDDTGYCPQCGAEVWDGAERCPKCGQYISGASHRPPHELRQRKMMTLIVVALVLVGLLWGIRALF